ncbi:hypothetical protein [Frigoribacterium sp. PhB24]|uniref:hypothetical protein n=1 Tax=Frigoribacterium sp. PhB24 TaxID=2485204 RepID=UPI000F4A7128|nr:hypothetical protein [Frigoribacterium sp. PhB24]ROS54125.1 hypothetical protein EDF50_0200 [Frigoribacterium sp. PhB24]
MRRSLGVRRSALAVAAVAVSFSMSLAVTGCAGGGGRDRDDHLTVDDAKSETMTIERSVVASFPEAEVVSVDQAPTGVLLSCSDDTYQWTGRVTVQLDGTSERAAFVGRFDEASHLVTPASASRCFALREGENSYDRY